MRRQHTIQLEHNDLLDHIAICKCGHHLLYHFEWNGGCHACPTIDTEGHRVCNRYEDREHAHHSRRRCLVDGCAWGQDLL